LLFPSKGVEKNQPLPKGRRKERVEEKAGRGRLPLKIKRGKVVYPTCNEEEEGMGKKRALSKRGGELFFFSKAEKRGGEGIRIFPHLEREKTGYNSSDGGGKNVLRKKR